VYSLELVAMRIVVALAVAVAVFAHNSIVIG
jgi:hypothetical protein